MITGSQIRTARKRARLTQPQLAKAVGVSQRTIGGWERDETSPGMAEPKLMEVLGPHMDDQPASNHPVALLSDAELLAEIARRFARSDRKVGNDSGTSAKKSDNVIEGGFGGPEPGVADAAQDEAGPSVGQMQADRQDKDSDDEGR